MTPAIKGLGSCVDQVENVSMPKSITIDDVPDEVCDKLAVRARDRGRSLQEYLRAELIELARQPDPDTMMADVRRRKAGTGTRLEPGAILTHRDSDRR